MSTPNTHFVVLVSHLPPMVINGITYVPTFPATSVYTNEQLAAIMQTAQHPTVQAYYPPMEPTVQNDSPAEPVIHAPEPVRHVPEPTVQEPAPVVEKRKPKNNKGFIEVVPKSKASKHKTVNLVGYNSTKGYIEKEICDKNNCNDPNCGLDVKDEQGVVVKRGKAHARLGSVIKSAAWCLKGPTTTKTENGHPVGCMGRELPDGTFTGFCPLNHHNTWENFKLFYKPHLDPSKKNRQYQPKIAKLRDYIEEAEQEQEEEQEELFIPQQDN
jgi:hypothetical protein